jgi:hypothetical protein
MEEIDFFFNKLNIKDDSNKIQKNELSINNITIKNAKKIQKWWKKYNSIIILRKIKNYLIYSLSNNDLQELSNKCKSITNICKGDGAGLLGGSLIDIFISSYFSKKLNKYIEYHYGESDMKILDVPLSQKKINGKSNIALDWSKNNKVNVKEYFDTHIMIINTKTEKWWKIKPKNKINNKISYDKTIKSGIYLIDKNFCKKYIKLTNNNKTNSLIESQYLYIMLQRSILQNLYIEIPDSNKDIKFNILNAFSE